MQTILLDDQQTSALADSYESLPVRDQAGTLLGHFTPNGGQERTIMSNDSNSSRADGDRWIECWNEWYFETDDEKSELPVAG